MFRRKRGSGELCNPGEEGNVSDKHPRLKHVKFPGKIFLLLGVAVVQLLNGTIVGQQYAPFDYTGCSSSRGKRLGSQQPSRWCCLGYKQT
eukprot:4473227-Ditylum_brightwellii.AAC.1